MPSITFLFLLDKNTNTRGLEFAVATGDVTDVVTMAAKLVVTLPMTPVVTVVVIP